VNVESAKAFIEKWVLARQVIERLPAWPEHDQNLYGAVVKQAPLWQEANTHEMAFVQWGKEHAWEMEDFERVFNEVGVPSLLRQAFRRRRLNRKSDHFVFSASGRPMHVTTWFIPFGFFSPPDPTSTLSPLINESLIVENLHALLAQLHPMVRLLDLVNDPLKILPSPVFINLRGVENLGWAPSPFCLWANKEVMARVNFSSDPVQGGLLSLSLAADTEESLGVLEDMVQVMMQNLLADGLGFYKFAGHIVPRMEAYEEAAVGMANLWAKMVFCSSGSRRGNAEFFFAKGTPNQLHASVRLKDAGGTVNALLTHNVSFHEPESLARIMAPWLSPQANHLAWQFSSAAQANYSDPRLASSHPFW
jgi:hypothetical protein